MEKSTTQTRLSYFMGKHKVGNKLHAILRSKGPMTCAELYHLTKIPRSTLHDNLVKLSLEGKVESYSLKDGKKGRPRILFKAV
jgi:predicted ArsR family transcriptional regulator